MLLPIFCPLFSGRYGQTSSRILPSWHGRWTAARAGMFILIIGWGELRLNLCTAIVTLAKWWTFRLAFHSYDYFHSVCYMPEIRPCVLMCRLISQLMLTSCTQILQWSRLQWRLCSIAVDPASLSVQWSRSSVIRTWVRVSLLPPTIELWFAKRVFRSYIWLCRLRIFTCMLTPSVGNVCVQNVHQVGKTPPVLRFLQAILRTMVSAHNKFCR